MLLQQQEVFYTKMLTDEQYNHLEMLLEGLATVIPQLDAKSASFVQATKERFDEYDNNTFISSKQLSWLESLYQKHVGPL